MFQILKLFGLETFVGSCTSMPGDVKRRRAPAGFNLNTESQSLPSKTSQMFREKPCLEQRKRTRDKPSFTSSHYGLSLIKSSVKRSTAALSWAAMLTS